MDLENLPVTIPDPDDDDDETTETSRGGGTRRKTDDDGARVMAQRLAATTSISTRTSFGRRATSMVERAGYSPVKRFA